MKKFSEIVRFNEPVKRNENNQTECATTKCVWHNALK